MSHSTFDRTVIAACRVYGISRAELLSPRRSCPRSEARAVVAWIMVRAFSWSASEMGRLLARHHSTILVALARIDRGMRSDERIRQIVSTIVENMLAESRSRLGELVRPMPAAIAAAAAS